MGSGPSGRVGAWSPDKLEGPPAQRVDQARRNPNLTANSRDRRTRLSVNAHIRISGRPYAVGDEIVTLRNSRILGVVNGTRATVSSIDSERGELAVRVAGQNEDVTLPRWYLERGHIAHGYALTVHKSQGATVDTAILYGDDRLYREAGYTALSRGRLANHVHTAVDPADEHDPLVVALQRSEAQQAAVEIERTTEASRPSAGMSIV